MFHLTALPYPRRALQPFISEQTLEFHHGAHHNTYVDTLNSLVKDLPYASLSLKEVIRLSAGKPHEQKIFNNAAQVWNHDFYWNSLTPPTQPELKAGPLRKAVEANFGHEDALLEALLTSALNQFGSGWCWLVRTQQDRLEVRSTSNAQVPWLEGEVPLLTCDVWEHAYYLDYQNRRRDYVRACLQHLLHWDFAEQQYQAA